MLTNKLMGGSSAEKVYVEDVFSTYLYTGTGAAQTITNGIDLASKGGMVWLKGRSNADPAWIMDTTRGVSSTLVPSNANAAGSISTAITAFNSTGFTLGTNGNSNTNNNTYASWTFRKAPKFFDVVTYTGNGVASRTVAHDLGSVPGMIIVKCTSTTSDWYVYHKSLGATKYISLNLTNASTTSDYTWNNTEPTSSAFTVSSVLTNVSGATYVAYLFAHDAGGFGESGTDSVVSCGSYTGNGSTSGPTVTLGWEPQYVMVKRIDSVGAWFIEDVMRGMSQTSSQYLLANSSAAETALNPSVIPTATGFTLGTTYGDLNASGGTYIYLAIRRGPMRTPTSGTSVFSPIISSATVGTKLTTNFPVDAQIFGIRTGTGNKGITADRLRGVSTNASGSGAYLYTTLTDAEAKTAWPTLFWDNTGFQMPYNYYSNSDVFWSFGRAPGFFDVVCYTGTGVTRDLNHNLGVVPEMMIVKCRSNQLTMWRVYHLSLGATKYINLNGAETAGTFADIWNNTAPTSSVFTVGIDTNVNGSARTNVAYLFASCPGVSKVGSYTGTGATQTINCGFTGGARFVLIKRTDSTGDWFTWDSARGIVAGNDPYLLMNSTAAEVTSTDYIDPVASGFEISSTAPAAINASGGSFIYLAIA